MFFQLLMLNISSIKELLHKPSEIQWNITGTLPGKLKTKISWGLSYKIVPPKITKTWEIAIFGGTLGAWEPMWNSMVYDFVNFWKFLYELSTTLLSILTGLILHSCGI